jgi:16S rRNA (guanine527-N7)-methyltransferase
VTSIIEKYFPGLTDIQKDRFDKLKEIYDRWNSMINVISRKDMDNFYLHHVLHSLSISKLIKFKPGSEILDVGTGGGFPGIPLSILFPDSSFILLDSIEKKIKVVSSVADELELKNVTPARKRVEEEKGKFDFVISRAVTNFDDFVKITSKNIKKQGINAIPNGIIYLKGGDLTEELSHYRKKVETYEIKDYFDEEFFETKKIIYLSV